MAAVKRLPFLARRGGRDLKKMSRSFHKGSGRGGSSRSKDSPCGTGSTTPSAPLAQTPLLARRGNHFGEPGILVPLSFTHLQFHPDFGHYCVHYANRHLDYRDSTVGRTGISAAASNRNASV